MSLDARLKRLEGRAGGPTPPIVAAALDAEGRLYLVLRDGDWQEPPAGLRLADLPLTAKVYQGIDPREL